MKFISGHKNVKTFSVKTILFFSLFISVATKAQEYNPWFLSKVLDNNNGLLQNSIGSMYFDTATGFLWMTTESGLVRYDGIEPFVFDRRVLPGMKTVRMAAIFPTLREGVLAMDRGGMLYKMTGAGIREYKADSINSPSLLDRPFRGVFSSIKFTNEVVNHLPATENDTIGKYNISQVPLSAVAINDSIWVSYSTTYFKIFNNKKEIARWKKSSAELPVLIRSAFTVYALNENGSGYKIDPRRLTCVRLSNSDTAFLTGKPRLFYDQVNNQPLMLKGNRLYHIWFNDTKVYTSYIATLPGLPENIQSILVHPNRKTIFVGSELSGLFIYTQSPFRTYKAEGSARIIGNLYTARNNIYATAMPDPDHILTNTSVLFNMKTGTHSIFPFVIARTNTLLFDNKQNIWYAYSDTLFRVKHGSNKPDKKFHLTRKKNPYTGQLNFLQVVFQSATGRIWVSTREYLGYIENDSLITYIPIAENQDNSFNYLGETKDGDLIAANQEGLFFIDMVKKEAISYKEVSSQAIRSFYIDNQNYCWIATYGNGGYVFDLTSKKFSRLPVDRNGYLLFGHVFCNDGSGNFLIPTNRGLFRVNRNHLLEAANKPGTNLFYQYFDINSGLESNEFNGGCQPSFNRLGNGDIVFPSLRGLVRVIIRELPEPHNYPIFIDRIETKGHIYNSTDKTQKFAANERNQAWYISFAQWDQAYSPGFCYKLDNDTAWTQLPEGERWIQLTDLVGGSHQLQVRFQAGLSPGQVSFKTIPFYVTKKYYEQTWFWIVVALLFFGFVYFVVRLQTIRLTKKNTVLEEKVNEKTKELVDKNEELSATLLDLENTIHELNYAMDDLQKSNLFKSRLIGLLGHDVMIPLQYITRVSGQLKVYSEKLSRETTLESLGEINNTASQLEFFGESIIHWIKLQNNEYKRTAEKFQVNKIVTNLVNFHQLLLAEKGNMVSNDVLPDLYFDQDKTLVKIILHNLLLNANKFTSGGRINVGAASENGSLTLTVSDNGRGMDQSKVDSLNNLQPITSSEGTNMEAGWGMGYSIIIDLVKFSEGRLHVESKVNEGTTVVVKLPSIEEGKPGI